MSRTRESRCVHEAFQSQAALRPGAPAVSCAGTTWTYAELNALANRFARTLRATGVRRGMKVGLFAARSAERIAAMLAIAKTGAAYVPLEPDLPAERMLAVADAAGVAIVVCLPGLVWTGPQQVVGLDPAGVEALPDTDLDVPVSPDDLFYLPFTSGSTGRPKGVEVPHRSVFGFFDVEYAAWGPGETHLHFLSSAWDGHVVEIYPSLISGGHVVVYPGSAPDPVEIARFATGNGVTGLFLPTQAFNTVLDVDPTALLGLRYLLFGGEKASPGHVAAALAALPAVRISNVYGPVECTGLATGQVIDAPLDESVPVPIGRALGDRSVYVVDDTFRLVADGTLGELCIGGPGVAHGYLVAPALTAEAFVPDPFAGQPGARMYRTGDLGSRRPDGGHDYLGRRDGQLKIRSFRVETGEIEMLLRADPAVADAAVVADLPAAGGPRLVAFVVPRQDCADREDLPERLRAYLAGRLPAAVAPAAVCLLDRLPMTLNRKLDRPALTEAAARVTAAAPARVQSRRLATPTEQTLAALWSEMLGVAEAGPDDDFFVLGGHSLAGTRMIARLRRRYDANLTLRDLYEAPTLAGFARIVDRRAGTGGGPGGIRRIPRQTVRRTAASSSDTIP